MAVLKELTRIEKVREFRIATRSGLKTAIEAVEAGWNPGDPIDHELTARMDGEYAKQARISNAAPALLEALRPLAGCEIIETDEPLGDEVLARYAFTMGEIRAARAAIASALGEG